MAGKSGDAVSKMKQKGEMVPSRLENGAKCVTKKTKWNTSPEADSRAVSRIEGLIASTVAGQSSVYVRRGAATTRSIGGLVRENFSVE